MNFSALPVIATARLVLRPLRIEDADDIFAFASRPETSEWLTWHPHPDVEHTRRFAQSVLDKYAADQPAQWVIAEMTGGKVIGLCGFVSFSDEDQKGEVAFVVSPDYWGRGVLTESLKAIVGWCLANTAIVRIEAKCEVGNAASERALQKCGLRLEGECVKFEKRKGLHRDFRMYAVTR